MIMENSFQIYENDQRDETTRSKQSNAIKYFCDRNMQAFEPFIKEELSKLQIEKLQSNSEQSNNLIQRLEFEDGRYVDYRDNKSENSQFELPTKTIIFINGVPGGIKYFGKLERALGSNFCRLINFYVPGLDKKDERRGSYQGRLDDISNLIEAFLDKMKIEKVIFALHSFGGLIVKNFAFQKPQRVEALIQIASITITKWQGFKIYENIESGLFNIDYNDLTFEKLQDETFRNQLQETILNAQKELSTLPKHQQQKLGPIMQFTVYDIISMLKMRLSIPGGIYEIIHRMRQVNKNIPRMFAYSPVDHLIERNLVEEEIYEFVVGENTVKRRILQQVSPKPLLDLNDFNSNYLFRFDDATHNLFHEKGQEIAILAKSFIRQLDFTQIINHQPKI